MNKKIVILIVLIILVVLIAAGFYFTQKKSQPVAEQEKPFTVEKVELGAGQLAKAFPTDLPIEPGSKTLQNYESTASDGRIQSTILVTTKKSLTQAVSDQVKFFESKDWLEIESSFVNTPTKVSTIMKYRDDRLTIVSQINPETKEKTVELTLIQTPIQK